VIDGDGEKDGSGGHQEQRGRQFERVHFRAPFLSSDWGGLSHIPGDLRRRLTPAGSSPSGSTSCSFSCQLGGAIANVYPVGLAFVFILIAPSAMKSLWQEGLGLSSVPHNVSYPD
jgi:hypothetical protein